MSSYRNVNIGAVLNLCQGAFGDKPTSGIWESATNMRHIPEPCDEELKLKREHLEYLEFTAECIQQSFCCTGLFQLFCWSYPTFKNKHYHYMSAATVGRVSWCDSFMFLPDVPQILHHIFCISHQCRQLWNVQIHVYTQYRKQITLKCTFIILIFENTFSQVLQMWCIELVNVTVLTEHPGDLWSVLLFDCGSALRPPFGKQAENYWVISLYLFWSLSRRDNTWTLHAVDIHVFYSVNNFIF